MWSVMVSEVGLKGGKLKKKNEKKKTLPLQTFHAKSPVSYFVFLFISFSLILRKMELEGFCLCAARTQTNKQTNLGAETKLQSLATPSA